ncbi:ABC transporter permease [Rhodococcoides corynebacterioides]|uniref:ABC transporter permease n=1 Tax=Rhodococcoides corynebacterioides TaxID=53972 RepID=A0ABS7P2D6_9NOCA|nr:ABC transporter permease [Rhodococcus corynebacterioides]MBY6350854.1 ABC transporter permease [Rhodococcus corynebacterioides]MBY6363206.1 ABC transporter permease [Rhodococcus corynebacterioides]MBY6366565.1 ABC transporter permease [Rhodococcus corynebacterioides]MBY6408066.1 ABC transporter permease [Rhodococcus corynebacterioides]
MSTANTAAAPATEKPPVSSRFTVGNILREPLLGPMVALVLAVIVFSAISDSFLNPQNVSLILQQSVVVGILAVGQTLIILTSGIDLSIGAVAVFGTIVMAQTAGANGPMVALGSTLAVCLAFGAINGGLVTVLRLPPFIVTLGTFTAIQAATRLLAGSETYRVEQGPLTFLGTSFKIGSFSTTYGVVAMLLVYLVMWYALSQTSWGKHIYAVGGNPQASNLSGIKSGRVLFSVYIVTGVIAAIAAWAALGRIPNADPNAYQNANLETITAVVIGGTSLFGGRGGVIGTLVGTLIVGVLRNGLTQAGVDSLYQNIATGILVIVAVAVDQFARRRSQ